MHAQRIRAIAFVSLLVVVVLTAGCGAAGDGIARQAVSGSVTFGGKPLEQGEITLSPIQAGPSAGGTIARGTFAIDRMQGPSAGKYRVMIVSIQPTGRQVRDADGPPGSKVAEKANVIPARYNFKSDLEIDIKKEGENTFKFDLTK
jgi:hypothetical protein